MSTAIFSTARWTDTKPVSEQHIQPCGCCCFETCYWLVSLSPVQPSLREMLGTKYFKQCAASLASNLFVHGIRPRTTTLDRIKKKKRIRSWLVSPTFQVEVALCSVQRSKTRAQQGSAELNTVWSTIGIARCLLLFFSQSCRSYMLFISNFKVQCVIVS